MKKALIVILFAIAGYLGFAAATRDTRTPMERISGGCEREFGAEGQIAVNECKYKALILEANELGKAKAAHERARLDRARQ